MLDKISDLARKPEVLLPLAFLAALTFNNWLLGPILNRKLFAKEGSVSEFSAITQPHYWVFRGLDMFSGALFILLAFALSRQFTQPGKARNFLVWGTLVLGAANIIDATFTLTCSETLSSACQIPVNISLRHLQIPSHGWSSIIIAICYFVLPLAGYMYAVGRKNRELMILSALAVGVALEAVLSVSLQYLIHHSYSIKASGVAQEIQMLLIGVWFFYVARSGYSYKAAVVAEPVKKMSKPAVARSK